MLPSMAKSVLLILSLSMTMSVAARGQSHGDTPHVKADTGSVGEARATHLDTVLAASDTLHMRSDTSIAAKDTATAKRDTLDIIVSTENANTMPGFRVQIGSTQDIAEAMGERSQAEAALTGYNVYIIYDSPYYKVRAGDFRSRYDAAQAANSISDHGFPGAWVVPDNVFKNPQRKSGR